MTTARLFDLNIEKILEAWESGNRVLKATLREAAAGC